MQHRTYRARKPFRFAGRAYVRGSVFAPDQVACPARKLRQLVGHRVLEERDQIEGAVDTGVPAGRSPEPRPQQLPPELVLPSDAVPRLLAAVARAPLADGALAVESDVPPPPRKLQGKRADVHAARIVAAVRAGEGAVDVADYERLPRRCRDLIDAALRGE